MKFALLILVLFVVPFTMAFDLDDEISEEDEEAFDEILEPIMKIYGFMKYSATVLAALFLVFAAINFMGSGEDQRKREGAKKSISYTLMGLLIIWAVPLVIDFLI